MALNINGTKLKKCNVNGVKCKHINVNGVRVWNAETTLTNLSGWKESAGSPDTENKSYWLEVTSSGSWDLSDYDEILTMTGTTSPALSYWEGGALIDGARYLYLIFADDTSKQIASWTYTYNYYETFNDTPNFSISNIDISEYTAEQKKSVKVLYANSVYCRDTYGSYFTEMSFETYSVIAS